MSQFHNWHQFMLMMRSNQWEPLITGTHKHTRQISLSTLWTVFGYIVINFGWCFASLSWGPEPGAQPGDISVNRMCKLMILVLAALWNTGWTHSSKQWHRAISALKGESPSLRSILDFQIPPDTNFLTIPPDSLEHLNYLLRVVYIPEQSPMKHILRGVDIPDLYEINQVLNYDGFWNEINANPERYSRMFADYVARQYQRQDLRAMKLMSQEEQEYQECAKDYDSFIAPITNLLSQILFNPCDEEEGGSPLPCINGTLPSFKMYRDGWKSELPFCSLISFFFFNHESIHFFRPPH